MKSRPVAASFDPLAVGGIEPQSESTLRDVEDDVGSDRIMTPEHPLWSDFLSKLSRIPICTGTTRQARTALAAMPGIDVQESLDALAGLGGTCDCSIELDVAPMAMSSGA
ncbi:MAG TPA: hypothetical protein VFT97_08080 [Candidatus Eisenbacteria bacterium]|nr:hypothetical protein [Candidatus Eisenbacteria bacterium]